MSKPKQTFGTYKAIGGATKAELDIEVESDRWTVQVKVRNKENALLDVHRFTIDQPWLNIIKKAML